MGALGQAVNKTQPPSAAKNLERTDSRKAVSFGDGRDKPQDELSDDTPSTVKPNFVKHINKTRTMSSRQKWDWAFDKILMVSTLYNSFLFCVVYPFIYLFIFYNNENVKNSKIQSAEWLFKWNIYHVI